MRTDTCFLRFFEIHGRLEVARPVGTLDPPRELSTLEWLPAAFQRSVTVAGVRLRVVCRHGVALGVWIERATAPDCEAPAVTTAPHPPHESAVLLIDATGSLVASSGAIPDDWSGGDAASLRKLGPRLVGGMLASTTGLHGADGTALTMVRLDPVGHVATPAFSTLTDAQLDVCEFAAQGLPVADIARLRGCSHETIRSHLRAAYRRLTVSSRAELVPVVHEWSRWRDGLYPLLRRRLHTLVRSSRGSSAHAEAGPLTLCS